MSERSPTQPVELLAVRGDGATPRSDELAVEEPLEIRVCDADDEESRVAVTMRTPGHDLELALGFLYTEALIASRDEVSARPLRELAVASRHGNVVTVQLERSFDAERLRRNFYATSSCGICGKSSIDQVDLGAPALGPGVTVPGAVLGGLPAALRSAQHVFGRTGGLHACGLFGVDGQLRCVREDVGRHNAVDKLVGCMLLDGRLPLADGVVLVSGRASFEIVQKVAMAGATVLCAISAPSSLAVELATRLGMTLVGFLREGGYNVYSRPGRIA